MTILRCVLLILCVKYLDCHEKTYRTFNNLTCFLCEPGTFLVDDCSADYLNAVCKTCPEGTYTPIHTQARYCQLCSVTCPNSNYESLENQREIKTSNCTSSSNIVCECRTGYWRESGDRGMCRRAKECGQGNGVTALASSNSDTLCEPCQAGQTFSNTSSANETCRPCTKCDGHLYAGRACEPDRDTECFTFSSTGPSIPSPTPTITPSVTPTVTPHVATKENHDGLKLGLGLGLSMPLVAAVGIFVACWYGRWQQTTKANKRILKYDEERPKYDRRAGIENHRTTFLAAAYVELSHIFPAREFRMCFRQLEIDECTIQRIETEHHGDVREQCYQLFIVWESMRTNKTKMSHLEWSLELIRKLKHHIDERLKDIPDGLKQQCYSILDEHSLEITKKLPRLNS